MSMYMYSYNIPQFRTNMVPACVNVLERPRQLLYRASARAAEWLQKIVVWKALKVERGQGGGVEDNLL